MEEQQLNDANQIKNILNALGFDINIEKIQAALDAEKNKQSLQEQVLEILESWLK